MRTDQEDESQRQNMVKQNTILSTVKQITESGYYTCDDFLYIISIYTILQYVFKILIHRFHRITLYESMV